MNMAHRKFSGTIRFTDERGDLLSDSLIKIRQKNHAFLFGCGAFDFIPFVTEGGDKNRNLTESWLEIFNYATLPFYWGLYEPEEGSPDRERLMKTAVYLKDKGVKVKGHPLCWHTECADWLLKYDNKTIMEKQLARIEREVSGFAGVIDMWDVINEVVIMPVFDRYDSAVTRLCREKGRVGLVKEVFQKAHECNPDAVLLINDFNTSADYAELIDGCLCAGVPISAIGIQSHQHQGYWGREKLKEVLERFSRFGLPLHFTENTLISGEIMPSYIEDLNDWQVNEWPTTPEGEERQAREIEEMYRILFGHPLVEAITTWDYRDGAWLNAPSGYVRTDGTRKPSHDMLRKLVRQEWWSDVTVRTNENGCAKADIYKGDYSVSCGDLSADITLTGEAEVTVVLRRKGENR